MEYQIISGKYEDAKGIDKERIDEFFDFGNVQRKFDLFYHWFNVIQELGHIFLDYHHLSMDVIEADLFVNDFAVCYLKMVDEKGYFNELYKLVNEIKASLPSPFPKDIDFKVYYKNIWNTRLMHSGMMHGYFKICCILDAFEKDSQLETLFSKVGFTLNTACQLKMYNYEIEANKAHIILNDCLENLSAMGIKMPTVSLDLTSDPNVQTYRLLK